MFQWLSFEPNFENIEAHFFLKFFHMNLKNLHFEFEVEIWHKRSLRSFICSATNWITSIISPKPCMAYLLSRNFNSSDQYPIKEVKVLKNYIEKPFKSKKFSVSALKYKICCSLQKHSSEVFPTNYTLYVKILVDFLTIRRYGISDTFNGSRTRFC